MRRHLLDAGALVVAALVAALFGTVLGLEAVWPVILAAALGIVPGRDGIGRLLHFVLGAGAGWLVLALQAGFLPDTALATALSWLVGVVIVVAVSLGTANRLPLWAGAAGLGTFVAAYEPRFIESPTTFLADSPLYLVVTLFAAAIGFAIAFAGRSFVPMAAAEEAPVDQLEVMA